MSDLLATGDRWQVRHADTLTLLPTLPGRSVDAVVTDPPYGIDFQGAAWDGADIRAAAASRTGQRLSAGQAFEHWTVEWAAQCLRLLKPGGHLAAFCSPRTFHRLAAGVEDAGFELRDILLWLHGQGMPKSRRYPGGYGTTLKPACEPIILARKPLEDATAQNLERWGTGALNIDATRIPDPHTPPPAGRRRNANAAGRWPANVLLSHTPDCQPGHCADACPVAQLDASDPETPSRFFYCAKASRTERDAGCESLPARPIDLFPSTASADGPRPVRNAHPTVKPLAVMRWLTRLVTPADGLVLDPFCGSGTTGAAAVLEHRRFLGIERDADYIAIAHARITHWHHVDQPGQGRPRHAPRVTSRPRTRGDQ